MSQFPEDLQYASTHEWVKIDDEGIATIGISDHAQDALGDIVFVELPEVGSLINAKDEIAVVESVKAASDIYSPLSGEIVAVNELLADEPEAVNGSPYDNGWFFKLKPSDEATLTGELADLLDAGAYSELCADE